MNINQTIDHTYLKAFGTLKDIDQLIEEAKTYQFKSVCINPTYVKYAAKALEKTNVLVCTVIGFPLGANTTETKVFETLNAIANGAKEIDMVINIGECKMGHYDYIENEIKAVVKAAAGLVVKVIIETCYLTKEEIKEVSKVVAKANATFIKTSTGFGTNGATVEDVKLMKEFASPLEVKASGGVRTKADFDLMIEAGATRIGTSNGIAIIQGQTGSGY
ncbi:MAG: deoxyribose-phosphate aldolase [Candidatus Izemoplasmatales bacterium]|nr:deoxyribose-phosphate aldolase [bacterium]MDZ4196251.1 deoxyribose-phosphate aldolase [Candidatus Izemoplasmatales bacterium]